MSQFDAYTQPDYIQGLCAFLGKHHPAVLRLKHLKPSGRTGRLPNWSQEVVEQLEMAVNEQAGRCEASDGNLAERLVLACRYRKLNYAQLARFLGVCREIVRLWCDGKAVPRNLERLAAALDVPYRWLESGGEENLPADTHLGVRVGFECMAAREQLYGLTLAALADVDDGLNEECLMAYLEQGVVQHKVMATLARKAGGRWHFHQGALAFVPWVPIVPHGLARRYWSDEVETIIAHAMAGRRSVYSAWQLVRQRCEADGLQYPQLVSLQRRVAMGKERNRRFGVDLNGLIATSLEMHESR